MKTSNETQSFEIKGPKVDGVCSDCAQNKFPIPNFSTRKNPVKDVLECVHSDLAGPFQPSIEGYRYYLHLIWLFFKSNPFKNFKSTILLSPFFKII